MIKRLIPILLGAVIVAAVLLASQWRQEPLKISGFIEAYEIRLGSRVGGRVARVLVEEGDVVQTGQALVELEPFDLLAREAEARANLAARQADAARLAAGYRTQEIAQAQARFDQLNAELASLVEGPRLAEIEAAHARVQVAEARLRFAQSAYDRTRNLFQSKTASADDLDRAVGDLEAAKATLVTRKKEQQLLDEGTRPEELDAARAKLAESEAALALLQAGYRQEDKASAQAAVDAGQAALDVILRQKEELQIVAPLDGTIESLDLQPGDLTAPGSPVMSMIQSGQLWVRAYLPERFHLKLGQQLAVTVDAYPEEFAGEVTFISRQAEFTPSNVQTPEERSKQVFRIKVMLREGLDRLRAGMAADVWLEPREQQP